MKFWNFFLINEEKKRIKWMSVKENVTHILDMNTFEWPGLDTIYVSWWLQCGESTGFLVFREELMPEKLEENLSLGYLNIF